MRPPRRPSPGLLKRPTSYPFCFGKKEAARRVRQQQAREAKPQPTLVIAEFLSNDPDDRPDAGD